MSFRRLLLIALVVAVLASGCSNRQTEFNEALDGIPSDPETFELEVFECVNDGEFILYEWGLRNLTEDHKTFAFDPFFTNSDGEEEAGSRELVGDAVQPGQFMRWEGGRGGGERFPVGDVECRFEVFDSVLGLFRDEN